MPTKTPIKKTVKTVKKAALQSKSALQSKALKKAPKKVTWDDIQAGFDKLQKSQDEAWAAIKETQRAHKETEKAIKDTQKNIGGLSNTIGSLTEHIMTPALPRKFKQFGFAFNQITTIKYAENVYAEVDVLLENGDQAMVVEVKTTLRLEDIDDHLDRMEKVRKHADEKGDKRQFFGAIAAAIADKSIKKYALKKGLFFIEPTGENVTVTKPEIEPRVW
jgi:predicted  nucleic acid-binding Zn-ribbon protein